MFVGARRGDVFVRQVTPVPARLVPRFELGDRFLQLRARRGPEDLLDQRPQLDHADVFGARLIHRGDEFGDAHLAPAGDVGFDVVADQLHAVDRAVAVHVVGCGPLRRLLVVPGDQERRVDGVGVRFEGQHLHRVQAGVIADPVVFARTQHGEVGRGAGRTLWIPAGEVVGDVVGVDVGPVEGEVDL